MSRNCRFLPRPLALAGMLMTGATGAGAYESVVLTSTVPAVNHPTAAIDVAAPNKLVGGGAWVDWKGPGSLLTRDGPDGTPASRWVASAKDHMMADPSPLTAYAVVISDPTDDWEVIVREATSPLAAHPDITVDVPSGYVMASGGCRVNWDEATPGNLLTASFPASERTWECRSKDHAISSPASITAFVIALRPRKAGLALPQIQIDQSTSATLAHPEAQVLASKAGFVVTGGGARADVPADAPGQLLTTSAPVFASPGSATPVGWLARSKDHAISSPGTVTSYVISLSLNDGNTAAGKWDPKLRGFADIHDHQFANLAFGGKFLFGKAFGPIDQALSANTDKAQHGDMHISDFLGTQMSDLCPGSPTGRFGETCNGAPVVFAKVWPNEGYPTFAGWPSVIETNHQKVYLDWLFRAVQGGMRLMVMLAEDSPTLCSHTGNDGRNCDDEGATIMLQIREAWAMQQAVDAQFGEGQGWYRIVRSPAEARQVVASGKLAVILGVETVHPPGVTDLTGLMWLHDMGIRHIFPIHQSDNVFGGASYFEPTLQKQRNVFGDPFFHGLPALAGQAYEMDTEDCPYEKTHRCNMHGLTPDGKNYLRGLMQAAMLIDVDHMSDKSFGDALTIAEELSYPVIASHAGFNDIGHQAQSHEGQLTYGEHQRIVKSGGLVGLITGQGARLGDVGTYQRPGKHQVDHICGRSSETFAQAYYYAIDTAPDSAVAFGSDFNAPLLQPGPRFGPLKCAGGLDTSRTKWNARLNYPFLARGTGQLMSQMLSGTRNFDFNEDGLATVGQLPDLIADLEVLGIPPNDLEPLFHSAEAYIQTWERAVAAARRMIRPMRTKVLPATVKADAPVSFVASADDPFLDEALASGDVFINNQRVGLVGQSITYTFPSTVVPRKCKWVNDPPDGSGRVRVRKPHQECEPAHRELMPVSMEVRAPGFIATRVALNVELP